MATDGTHDLAEIMGGCGWFQVMVVTAINFAYMSNAWVALFMVFGLYNPGWTCMDEDPFALSTLANETTLHQSSSIMLSPRNITFIEWRKDCATRKNCSRLMYNPESSTVATEWDLTCDSSWVSSIIISVQMSGILVGSFISGQIGDKFGRKLSLYGSVAVTGISQLSAFFPNSWQVYAGVMFFIGIGAGGTFASTFHYPLEFVTTWWRGILFAFPSWNIGAALFVLTAFIFKDWRYLHLCGAFVSTLVVMTAFYVPESIRWLAVSRKVSKAKDVVAKIAHINKRLCPDTQVLDDIAREENAQKGSYTYGYSDLFKIKSIRGNNIKFGLIWIVVAVTYYTISFGAKSLSGNFYLNVFILSVFDFPAVILVAPLVTIMGRRKACLLYFALASACSFAIVAIIFTTSGSVKHTLILVLALICKTFVLGVWKAIKLYSSELFPTVVRSLHYGYVNSMARIGAIIAPYIVSNDPGTLYIPFLLISILLLFVCGIIYTLPETKGKPLQDRLEFQSLNVELQEAKLCDKRP